MKTIIVAAAALVDTGRRILLAERPAGKAMAGLWEFPGGKMEAGELPHETVIRELAEEVGIKVSADALFPASFVAHRYENSDSEPFNLLMMLYMCYRWKGIPTAREGQTLRWCSLDEMAVMPMPPADIPLIPVIKDIIEKSMK